MQLKVLEKKNIKKNIKEKNYNHKKTFLNDKYLRSFLCATDDAEAVAALLAMQRDVHLHDPAAFLLGNHAPVRLRLQAARRQNGRRLRRGPARHSGDRAGRRLIALERRALAHAQGSPAAQARVVGEAGQVAGVAAVEARGVPVRIPAGPAGWVLVREVAGPVARSPKVLVRMSVLPALFRGRVRGKPPAGRTPEVHASPKPRPPVAAAHVRRGGRFGAVHLGPSSASTDIVRPGSPARHHLGPGGPATELTRLGVLSAPALVHPAAGVGRGGRVGPRERVPGVSVARVIAREKVWSAQRRPAQVVAAVVAAAAKLIDVVIVAPRRAHAVHWSFGPLRPRGVLQRRLASNP